MKEFNKKYSKYGIQERTAPLSARIVPWSMYKPKKRVSTSIMPYIGKILEAEKKKCMAADITPQIGKILNARKKKYASASVMPQLAKILQKTRA